MLGSPLSRFICLSLFPCLIISFLIDVFLITILSSSQNIFPSSWNISLNKLKFFWIYLVPFIISFNLEVYSLQMFLFFLSHKSLSNIGCRRHCLIQVFLLWCCTLMANWFGLCRILIFIRCRCILPYQSWFCEIHNFEEIFPIWSSIFNLEIKPLLVASSICINLHVKLVFIIVDHLSLEQVSTFESWIK